ncbi:hypothetical protein TNCV_1013841 [Trichonephila clavipes]|uniref:Uncharacterized protein n=1 Tax=Trichonephila clavipes TaxID=2585209 RepID=A0A8X6VXK2_TRICX|nr:hypothetical protein TNCV_1013841 [Trichonephila clavipes]
MATPADHVTRFGRKCDPLPILYDPERFGNGLGPPTSLPLPPTTREDLRLNGKGTIHLQTTISSPGFEPSPYGITVSVVNHYTVSVTS